MGMLHGRTGGLEWLFYVRYKHEIMKTIYQLCTLALPCILLAACSAPVHVQKDTAANLASYHTYSWVETHSDQNDKSARAMAYADITVKNETAAMLQQRGWQEVSDHPDLIFSYDVIVERSREQRILELRVPGIAKDLAASLAVFAAEVRKLELRKPPSIAETIDWARALITLGANALDKPTAKATLGVLLKYEEDKRKAESLLEKT